MLINKTNVLLALVLVLALALGIGAVARGESPQEDSWSDGALTGALLRVDGDGSRVYRVTLNACELEEIGAPMNARDYACVLLLTEPGVSVKLISDDEFELTVGPGSELPRQFAAAAPDALGIRVVSDENGTHLEGDTQRALLLLDGVLDGQVHEIADGDVPLSSGVDGEQGEPQETEEPERQRESKEEEQAPTPEPTAEPTPEPTAEPTPEPTAEPTPEPTAEPTAEPMTEPMTDAVAKQASGSTLQPTAEPELTGAPESNEKPEPIEEPEPTGVSESVEGSELTGEPEPTEVSASTEAQEPVEEPEPIEVPESTEAPESGEAPEPTEVLEPVEEPEPIEEPLLDVSQQVVRNIIVEREIADIIYDGDVFWVRATLVGYDDVEYTLQWQYDDGKGEGWKDQPNANELELKLIADQENVNYRWRILVSFVEPTA